MSKIALYNYFRSSTSYRARIALNWKSLQFDYVPVHLINDGGGQHTADYRKINPLGEVPTLIHDDHVIGQSFAIIEYLDEVFPQPALFPKDSYGRAKVRQICESVNCGIHPLQNLKVLQFLEKTYGFTQEQKDQWTSEWITRGLKALEALLKETSGTYAFGNQVTAADLFIVPQVFSSERFKVNVSQFPLISKINDECLKLPAFQKAHPFRQIDTPTESKIH